MNLNLHSRIGSSRGHDPRIHDHGTRLSLLSTVSKLAVLVLIILPTGLLGNPQIKQEGSNSQPENTAPAAVQHVKLLLENGSPALEIITTAPVGPQISKTNNGTRLLIDLPNTNMSVPGSTVPVKNKDLSALRLNRSNTTPPMVHVEVDFRRPLGYTWDSSGNRLLITFHDLDKEVASAPPTTPASVTPLPVSAPAPAPAGDLAYVVPAEALASGASITADSETTVLRLKRAGDVYVCPRTTVSVVHSKNGPDLMLALNDGGLETHIALKNSADEVVTPDFRILLRGPGEFHYAIRADARGNTCVRTLPGNTASAIIYELMGDGTYDVRANDQLVFRNGKLTPANPAAHSDSMNSSDAVLAVECGCPPPVRPALLASLKPEPRIAVENASPDPPTPNEDRAGTATEHVATLAANPVSSGDPIPSANAASSTSAGEVSGLSQSLSDQPHVQVEASLTFTPNPARQAASQLPASSRQLSSPVPALPPSPEPVQPSNSEPHKSVFGKIKSFFSRVF